MRSEIHEIVGRFTVDRQFDSATPLSKLGIDSLRLIEVIFTLENELGVSIPDAYMSEQWFESADSIAGLFEKIRGDRSSNGSPDAG